VIARAPARLQPPAPGARAGQLRAVAALMAALLPAAMFAACETQAAPQLKEMSGSDLTIEVVPGRIKWGEEAEVTIRAVNTTGLTLPGGIYVSFDEDVLVLEVKGGTLLRAGATAYNLKTSTSPPITRPMVELWERSWAAGTERRIVLTVLPMVRDRIRVRARMTLLEQGNPPQIHVSPGPFESRALDETQFPTRIEYIWVARHAGLRRALRRIERRIRNLDDSEQRRFALALATAMDDPKALTDMLADAVNPDLQSFSQALHAAAPRISERLRRDPVVALDNLRCLMANLGCQSALAYFGVPLSFFELDRAEQARLAAKKLIEGEPSGHTLVALLDAEGFTYRQEKASGVIIIQLGSTALTFGAQGLVVRQMLEQIVATLGPAAERIHEEANGLSFARLRAQLVQPSDSGEAPRDVIAK
jgi:hypothetical protein